MEIYLSIVCLLLSSVFIIEGKSLDFQSPVGSENKITRVFAVFVVPHCNETNKNTWS